jgi:hypothetical protein
VPGSMRAAGLGTRALMGIVGVLGDSGCLASGLRRSNCTVPVGDFAGVETGIGEGTSWEGAGGFVSSKGGTSDSVMETVEVEATSTESSRESTEPSSCSYNARVN